MCDSDSTNQLALKDKSEIELSPIATKKTERVRVHYTDVIMSAMASQITSLTIIYSIVYSGTDEREHQSSASLAFVRGIHRSPVNFPHKWPVTHKLFLFDDFIMFIIGRVYCIQHQILKII